MKTLRKDYPKVRQYVKHGNTYYQVDLRGKHHVGQKFKNFNDRKEALRFAADIGDTVAKNGISALATVKDERVAAWTEQCGRYGRTPEDAIALAVNFWLQEKAKMESPFMAELLSVWLDDKIVGVKKLRPKTIKSIREMANVFKKDFGTMRIKEVDSAVIENYLKSKELSQQTKKNIARYLQQFFNWAIFRKYHSENPAEYWVKQIEVKKGTVKFYTVDQVEQTMRLAMKPENLHMTAFFALGIFGGLRPEEIQKMTWQKNVKMDSREIFVSHDISKTKADRQFTMSDTLFEWLESCREIKALVPLANLQNYRKKITKNLPFPFVADGYRHTFATFHYAEHKNYEQLRFIMGNSPGVIQRHYKGTISQEEIAKFKAITPKTCSVQK
jgi:integrase